MEVVWPAFLGALAANALTAIVVYALILHSRGHRAGQIFVLSAQTLVTMGRWAVNVFIALLFLGAIAYAVKLSFTEGLLH